MKDLRRIYSRFVFALCVLLFVLPGNQAPFVAYHPAHGLRCAPYVRGSVYDNRITPYVEEAEKGPLHWSLYFESRSLTPEVRTVSYRQTLEGKEGEGPEKIVLTLEEVKRGKRLFNVACGSCHVGGLTKTNPNVGLDIASLENAYPSRTSISSLVEFLKSPKSYDGVQSIAETHPSIESCDLFPKMRNLTREDLVAISGHILLQGKILKERWGGGKIYY